MSSRLPTTNDSTSSYVSPALQRAVLIMFGLFLLSYLVLFYADGDSSRGREALTWITAPDLLVKVWAGGDLQYAQVSDRFPVLFVMLKVLVMGYAVGHAALSWLQLRSWTSLLERFLLRIGAGLNLVSLYTLAIGLAGWLHQSGWFYGLFALASVLSVVDTVRARRRTTASPASESPAADGRQSESSPNSSKAADVADSVTWFARWGLVLAVPLVLLYLWMSMQPPWQFDVREYHLQVPKEWYRQGEIGFLSHNVYGNMPLGAEMHALVAMIFMPGPVDWWYGALAGKAVIASLTLLTALALYLAGRRFLSPLAGVFAALLYLSIPWVFHVSTIGLIEGAYAFYFFLAVYCVLVWEEYRSQTEPRTNGENRGGDRQPLEDSLMQRVLDPRLILAGFFAGAAAACKYPAVVFVIIPLGLWVLLCPSPRLQDDKSRKKKEKRKRRAAAKRSPRPWRSRLAEAVAFSLAVVAGCGLWYGKNLVLAGNPVYPLAYSVFGGTSWTPEKNARWTAAHEVPANEEGERFTLSIAKAHLIRLAWQSTWLSPILVPFFLWALVVVAARRYLRPPPAAWPLTIRLVALIAIVLGLWWLFSHRYDRFLIPVLPAVALVAAVGATWSRDRYWRRFVQTVLVLGLVVNGAVIASGVLGGDVRILLPLENQRLQQPLGEKGEILHFRVHPVHRYLNEVVPPGYRVLLVGEAQVFDLEPPALYNTCFDDCWLEKMMKDRTAHERREIFRRYRISHVFVHWDELARYRSPGNYGYTDYVTRDVFEELVEQGILRETPTLLDEEILKPHSGQLFEVVGYREDNFSFKIGHSCIHLHQTADVVVRGNTMLSERNAPLIRFSATPRDGVKTNDKWSST